MALEQGEAIATTPRPVRHYLLAAMLAVPAALSAQAWLPDPVQDGLVEQLAGRLSEASGSSDTAAWQPTARQVVTAIRDELSSWSMNEAAARAPTLRGLDFPSHPNRYLDAMARAQVCSLPLLAQFENATAAGRRRGTAVRLTAATMAVLYFRTPFVDSGGSNADIEAFLTGESMARWFDAAQQQTRTMVQVNAECDPLVDALLARVP
jgi:hypothetical protein